MSNPVPSVWGPSLADLGGATSASVTAEAAARAAADAALSVTDAAEMAARVAADAGKQSLNANLTTLAGVIPGVGGLAILDDASVAAILVTLGLVMVPTYAGSAPAIDGATLTTAGGALGRIVVCSFNLVATVANAANITVAIETGVGTGSYTSVPLVQAGIGLLGILIANAVFAVPTGRRYKFSKGALAGTTETFSTYSTIDI